MARRGKKSHRGLAKRIKVTKTGKVLASKSGYHHKQRTKRKKYRRQARRGTQITGAMRKRFLWLLSS